MANTIVDQEHCKLFLEQNKLLWGRLQTAYLVEAGTLTAYFVTSAAAPWLSVMTLLLSVVLLVILFLLVCRDVQHLHQLQHPLIQRIDGLIYGTVNGRLLALLIPIVLVAINCGLAIWKFIGTSIGLLPSWTAPWIVGLFGLLVLIGAGAIFVSALRADGVREAAKGFFAQRGSDEPA